MRRYLFVAVALLLAGCAGAAAPTGSQALGNQPSQVVIATPEAAAARVIALQPGLAGIEEQDPDVIGGCCFWQATENADGFEVTFEVGWGDCPAGCIERHRWVYAVARDGSVALIAEQGGPVPAGLPAASGDPASGGGGGGGILPGGSGIRGTVTAGPTCPVVSADDPNCDDRPIAGTTVIVLDAAGREVARVVTDADGRYAVALPAGPYVVEPQPAEGILRRAESVPVTVGDDFAVVDLAYDTGIR